MIKRLFLLSVLFVAVLFTGSCQYTAEQNKTSQPDSPLTMLYFSERASDNKRVQGYEFRREDGRDTACFHLANAEAPYPVPVDQAWVDTLTGFIRQYDLLKWNGFHGSDSVRLDGTQFTLCITFADGASVTAGGCGKLPPGYGEASSAIDAHFMQLLPEELRDW